MENAAAKQMDMQMVNGLAGPTSIVNDRAIALRFDLAVARKASRDGQHPPKKALVIRRHLAERN